jgi:hypothetical protein
MKKQMNRRLFLRGLGGAAVAVPFLSSVAERAAKAAGESSVAPKRLIVLFTHYGCLTDRWFPAKSHGPLSTADYQAMQTLSPLAPYANKLLMVRGIRAMNEWSFAGTLGQTTDPHTQVTGSFFTCQPVTPADGKFTATPTGRSLDHICAEQVNPSGGGPLFLQIGGVNGSSSNTQSTISFDKPNQIFPGIGSPTQIYNNLTNLFGKGAMSPDSYRVARGKSVIDIVRDDLSSLQRVDMSASDKQKLADWVDLLHQTSGTVASAQCTADTATALGVTSASVQAAGGGGFNVDLSKVTNVMMDLAVLTAICDANRVIFMKYPPNYVFSFLGLTQESHGLSHRIGSANMGGSCLSGVLDMIHKIDAWYAEQFAYLVGKLDSFAEGDQTLLDNTATVWFQEMSDGNSHNLNNLPILQAGGCGGYFKVGQAVNVQGGKADLTVGHSDDDCKNGESPFTSLDSLGTPPDQATMPINKYYCNLMNAIGVKAGADGFPAVGGSQAVTHFGKYDDSKLFNTSQPAQITNPGEYLELRANG